MCEQEKSDSEAGPSKPTRKLPRISTATGGLMPGIDPIKFFQSVEELDDIEYVERLKRGFRD